MEKQRDTLIDLLKGIGITSIVIGHSSWILPGCNFPIGPFVYTYHLMIFFFVAGMSFKPRNDITPYMQIGKRLGGVLPIYVKYSIVFILLHNFFLKIHILKSDTIVYRKLDIIKLIFEACIFGTSEAMLSAFWFVSMFFIGVSMFMLLYYHAEKMKYPIIWHILCGVLTAIVGIWLNDNEVILQYHIQTSVLGITVIYLGYLFQHYRQYMMKYLQWWLSPILGIVIWKILSLNIGMVELSANMILHPLIFYPITILGITFCICIAQGFDKVGVLRTLFCTAGKNSYHIMALHIITFKCFDLMICKIWKLGNETLECFPYSFEKLWPIYYIVGVAVPLILVYGERWLIERTRIAINKKFLK